MRSINEINDPRLVKALAHPLRVNILSALEHRTASPSELSEELGVPLPNLSYHIRMLVQLELLKLVKTRPRRGAIEHYYKAAGPVTVTDQAWGEVPSLVKEAMVSSTLRQIGEQVDAAARQGGFEAGHAVLGWRSLKLDDKAIKQLAAKMVEIDKLAAKLAGESAERWKEGDPELIDAGAALLLFKKAPAEHPDVAAATKKGSSRSGKARTAKSRPSAGTAQKAIRQSKSAPGGARKPDARTAVPA